MRLNLCNNERVFHRYSTAISAAVLIGLAGCAAGFEPNTEPLRLPFDAYKDQVTVDAKIKGAPVRLLIDTGVDPSLIRLDTATRLGLPVSAAPVGEADGVGEGRTELRESSIQELELGGRVFMAFDAAAANLPGFDDRTGKPIDGILGYSFLKDRILMIDYPNREVIIYPTANRAQRSLSSCRKRYDLPLQSYDSDIIPIIPQFDLGGSKGPVSIDTGSGGDLSLMQAALSLPALQEALVRGADAQVRGARGLATVETGILNAPIGFGPFKLPAGQSVTMRKQQGSLDTRIGNAGNRIFGAMGLRMLLDYPGRRISFGADCRAD